MKSTLLTLLCGALAATSAWAGNWPQFRGPAGDGRSDEAGVPTRWSATENVLWKTPIPGEGHSSPIVWDNAVFLTSALPDSGERVLVRLDAESGRIVWQAKAGQAPRESMHRENSSASSTPVTDGQSVFTSFQVGDRAEFRAYDFAGKEKWSVRPLQFEGEHGYSYTPVIYRDLVIYDVRQEGEAAVIALDKNTGQVRWRAEPKKKRISHVAPLLVEEGGRTMVVVSGSDETAAYDPASGNQIWRCEGPSDVSVAGLSYGEGMIFATAGYPARTRMAVRVSGRGDVTRTGVVWKSNRQVTYVPSPVYDRGYLYTVVDDGLLFCFDARTGEAKWEHRLGGRFRSSLILAGGIIYATDDKGKTTLVKASPAGFEQAGQNDLGEFVYTTPAISNQRLYLRTGENLYCIGRKAAL